MVGICELNDTAVLSEPWLNTDIARLSEDPRTRQTITLASGIDLIMADLEESMESADKSTAQILQEHGMNIDIKCSEGPCGV